MPEPATKNSVLLNHKVKHHVKTAAGLTKEFHQSTSDSLSFGKGQQTGSKMLCTGIVVVSVCLWKRLE
eukprot:14301782-Ditylum_brightwellii.AAC.1